MRVLPQLKDWFAECGTAPTPTSEDVEWFGAVGEVWRGATDDHSDTHVRASMPDRGL